MPKRENQDCEIQQFRHRDIEVNVGRDERSLRNSDLSRLYLAYIHDISHPGPRDILTASAGSMHIPAHLSVFGVIFDILAISDCLVSPLTDVGILDIFSMSCTFGAYLTSLLTSGKHPSCMTTRISRMH